MMTTAMIDRKLLELAAKAAGIKALRGPDGILRDCTGRHPAQNIYSAPAWNPLTDDGDALRLAVKLDIDILTQDADLKVGALYPTKEGSAEVWEGVNNDPYTPTRRAIVRAAAEIGKDMK